MAQTYYSQILGWDWKEIVNDAQSNPQEVYDIPETIYGYCYLGTVFSLTPSGKYYMPFACSNVTLSEAHKDEAWYAALDKVAEKHGGWIESGEGDPCDLFFVMPIEKD